MLVSFVIALVACSLCPTADSQSTFFTDHEKPSVRSWESSSSSAAASAGRQERYFTVASSITKLALDLGRCRSGTCSSNVVFSPLSLSSALSMLLLGAGGNSYAQLRDALSYDRGADDDRIHQSFQLILERLAVIDRQASDSVLLKIANGLFVQKNLPLLSSYVSRASNYYRSEIRELDFLRSPFTATSEINQWVSEKTNRKINSILSSQIPPSTRVVLANAVYFNANWENPFPVSETRVSDFVVSDTETIPVEMMGQHLELPYMENLELGFRAVGLPYKGDEIGMFIIMPTTAGGLAALNELEAKLTPDILDSIIPNAVVKSVALYLPRFRIEQRVLLKGALRSLGVSDLFSQSANLTRMIGEQGHSLDDIIHQTVIEVTETGTEAAAATVVMLSRDAPQKVFRVNQPFLFFIQDINSRVNIFWGRVVRPSAPRGISGR